MSKSNSVIVYDFVPIHISKESNNDKTQYTLWLDTKEEGQIQSVEVDAMSATFIINSGNDKNLRRVVENFRDSKKDTKNYEALKELCEKGSIKFIEKN